MARPYPRHHSRTWFLARWPYRIFMLRELSAVFMAAYMVLLLVLVQRVHDGPKEFEDYLDVLQSPVLIVFHAIAIAFAVLHSVTWFQAVPQAVRLFRGEERVPPQLLIAGIVVAWIGVSTLVAIIFLWS